MTVAPLRSRLAWVVILSFASGFPFGLFNDLVPVYLRLSGASRREIGLLSVLARRPGVVFPRERLCQLVWGPDFFGDQRTVDVHVTWLRDKLRGATARIETVWGVGYKLVESDGTAARDTGAKGSAPSP